MGRGFCANAAVEAERLKASYDQLQHSSSTERFDLQDKIYKLRNELQDTKDRMAAEQIVLGELRHVAVLLIYRYRQEFLAPCNFTYDDTFSSSVEVYIVNKLT